MDTQKITSELLATGLTQQQLAALVPCSQSTIAAFVNGTRGQKPSYAIATRLLELHAERCVQHALVPVEAFDISAPASRRATDPEPSVGHRGRQPPSPGRMLDSIPERSVVDPAAIKPSQ